MKKILILFSIVTFFISCKDNVVNGFDAVSEKEKLVQTLNGSEWTPNQLHAAYYSKIVFDGDNLLVTIKDGETKSVGYQVTNVTGPEEERPSKLQLRLKTDLQLDEIYISRDFTELESVVYDPAVNSGRGMATFYNKTN